MNISPGRYIVGVSGGVDSVVLLDMLAEVASSSPEVQLIVAHFDHGIRDDSVEDARFVANLAKKYNLPFETERVELGPGASEAEAREARYAFLKSLQEKHHAIAIITAHHQDDMLETSIINILRGTSHRGLHSLKSHEQLIRPLLHLKKVDIYEYAKNNLKWREDSTNTDTSFLRNKIRHEVLSKSDERWRESMLEKIKMAAEVGGRLDREIDQLVGQNIRSSQAIMSRSWFVKLPHAIATEVVVAILRKLKIADIDKQLVERLTIQIKTTKPGKKLDIDKDHYLLMTKRSARITNRATHKTVRVYPTHA